MSYPVGNTINDFIDPKYSAVQYSSFDHVISVIQKLGKSALIGNKDLKSGFRLLPIYPGRFCLLMFTFDGLYFIVKMMPMGCSQSCSYFEKNLTFIGWAVKPEAKSQDIDHYFFFAGKAQTNECERLRTIF